MEIHKNDNEGLQVEWRDVLLTLRPNAHHGISGSIAVKDKEGGTHLLHFHGKHPEMTFPVALHEEVL